jgi:hypothetical protein
MPDYTTHTYTDTTVTHLYTIVDTGYYDIMVQGGAGGAGGNGALGGQGAYEHALFFLTTGQTLIIGVGNNGQAGGALSTKSGGGGGGLSYVYVRNSFAIAAGGGGGGAYFGQSGGNATFTSESVNKSYAQTGGYNNSFGVSDAHFGRFGGYPGYYFTGRNGAGGCGWVAAGDSGYGDFSGTGSTGLGVNGYGHGGSTGNAPGGGYVSTGGGAGLYGGGGGAGFYGGSGGGGGRPLDSSYGAGGGGSSYISILGGASYSGGTYALSSTFLSAGNSSDPSYVSITLTCYLPGTRILTTQGEIAVEDLKIGDCLPTLSGENVPIKWLGLQQFMGQFATKDTSPVRFHVGSLGEGLPKRDLYVSAGHSMKIGDHLVDARLLVNGVTITQHQRSEQINYYHIDLGEHHCILAEGVWSESYLECNANRETFVNAGEFYDMHPYHLTKASLEKCLPHVADYRDPRHSTLFKTLLAHIPADLITTDSDLHLLADNKRLDPYEFVPHAFMFRVPAGTQVLRLKSRANSPCEIGLPSDNRPLGFCLNSLSAQSEDGTVKIIIEPHHPKLNQGFHASEENLRRWTNGDALLPNTLLGDCSVDMILTLKGCALTRYHISNEELREHHTTRSFE